MNNREDGLMDEFRGEALPMTDEDYDRAALTIGCERAAIVAVARVESSGAGFLADGRPKILFESRWFSRLTGGRWDGERPEVSTPTWVRNYSGGAGEYDRLAIALSLNREAALKSASWGMFQVLGVNHGVCGYARVGDMVASMMRSEGEHLDAFVGFVISNRLVDELRDRRWADFARVYNGPGYAANHYDKRMAEAYAAQTGGLNARPSTKVVQAALRRAGEMIDMDGITGPMTTAAIERFQREQGLSVTSWADDETLAALGLA